MPYIWLNTNKQQSQMGKKGKKNKVQDVITWYCSAEHDLVYGLLKLAENSGLTVDDIDRELCNVVYFNETADTLVFDYAPHVEVDTEDASFYEFGEAVEEIRLMIRDAQQEEEVEADDATTVVVDLEGERGVPGCDVLTAQVYASGVRIDGTYGKRCWIAADDLSTIYEQLQELQDQD
jgi:hypothetical protein